MQKNRDIRGHIDCPTCGAPKGMRITPDKNGEPFGFCEANCGQQLRIGGDKRRVRDFVARHPWAGTVTEAQGAPTPAAKPAPNPVTVTEAKQAPNPVTPPKPKKPAAAGVFDFLLQPGGA